MTDLQPDTNISAAWSSDKLSPTGRRFFAVLRETAGAARSKA